MKKSSDHRRKTFSIHKVKLKALGGFLFSLVIVYLAGFYFGGILLFLFYCLLLLSLFSLILLFLAIKGIKYLQYFSTDHPVKGETIVYRLVLSNKSMFPISEVSSTFVIMNPFMTRMIPDFRLSLRGGETKEFTHKITCSFRGIYKVGLSSIQISDIMNLITLSIGVWHRTFYVYPMIIPINNFKFGKEGFLTKDTATSLSGIPDITLVKGIREYRRTDPVRHMYWKKFVSIGQPVLKEYDRSTTPEVSIYVDLYIDEREQKTVQVLEREDVSVEILTALTKYYLEREVKVIIRCPCNPLFNFRGYLKDHFNDYYKQTINLISYSYLNPIHLFKVDMKNGILESKSIIFITHRTDPDLFNFVEESINSSLQVLVIFNHMNSEESRQYKNKRFFNSLRDKGAHIVDVHSTQTIAEDLEKYGKMEVH